MLNKQGLNAEQLMMVQSEVEKKGKNKTTMVLLWLFTGVLGGHRFYMGNTGYAIAMLLLSWATFGVWVIVDIFIPLKTLDKINEQIEAEAIMTVRNLAKQQQN